MDFMLQDQEAHVHELCRNIHQSHRDPSYAWVPRCRWGGNDELGYGYV